MKILIIVGELALRGGGERAATDIANFFAEEFGYIVQILSVHNYCTKKLFSLSEKIELKSLGYPEGRAGLFRNVLCKLESFSGCKRLVASTKPDVIIGFGTYPSVIAAYCANGGIDTVGYEQVAYRLCPAPWRIVRRFMYKRLSAVVALTQRDGERLAAINNNVAVIPNSTHFRSYPRAPLDTNCILAVGRLTEQKGFDLLIDIFRLISSRRSRWVLKIVGSGDMEDILRNKVAQLSLTDFIEFVPQTLDIIEHYRSASIFVLPSRWEGFPLVLVESQALGLPAVSFDCETGPAELIQDGVSGYLIRPGDIQGFADKVMELIDDGEKRRSFGEQAHINSEAYTVSATCQKWKSLIDSINSV